MFEEFSTTPTEAPPQVDTTETDDTHIMDVPIVLHTEHGMFVVDDVGAWAYQTQGVFATGYWLQAEHGQEKHSVLIPYARLNWIEFDFEALDRYDQALALAVEDEADEAEAA